MLLCEVGQVLDRGSAGDWVGNVTCARKGSDLRRRSKAQRGKERVLCSNRQDRIQRGLLQLKQGSAQRLGIESRQGGSRVMIASPDSGRRIASLAATSASAPRCNRSLPDKGPAASRPG